MNNRPTLQFYNHITDLGESELQRLINWSELALPDCLQNPAPEGSINLPNLNEVEISIVSDATIGNVHAEFFDDPEPTDVITFQHGEILVSYDTAKQTAEEFPHSALEELFLYVVHGLLHLNGHLDHETKLREIMHQIQNRIWSEVCGAQLQ